MNIITIFDGKSFQYKGDIQYMDIQYIRSIITLELTKIEISRNDRVKLYDYVTVQYKNKQLIGMVQIIENQKEMATLHVAFGIDMYLSEMYLGSRSVALKNFSFNNYGQPITIRTDDISLFLKDGIIQSDVLFRQAIRLHQLSESVDFNKKQVVLRKGQLPVFKLRLDDPRLLNYELELVGDGFNSVEIIAIDDNDTVIKRGVWGITDDNKIGVAGTSNLKKPEKRVCLVVDDAAEVTFERATEELKDQTYDNKLVLTLSLELLEKLGYDFQSILGSEVELYQKIMNKTIVTAIEVYENTILLTCGLGTTNLTDQWRDK